MNHKYEPQEMIEAIIAEAKLKPREERVIVLHFGLRGEQPRKLTEIVALFRADPSITLSSATLNTDWVRRVEGRAASKMRGATQRLKIDIHELRQLCTEEPYLSLIQMLYGLVN